MSLSTADVFVQIEASYIYIYMYLYILTYIDYITELRKIWQWEM